MPFPIDSTLTPLENMFELIKYSIVDDTIDKTLINTTNMDLSAPAIVEDRTHNTIVTISAIGSKPFTGQKTVIYDRVTLTDTVLKTNAIMSTSDDVIATLEQLETHPLYPFLSELSIESVDVELDVIVRAHIVSNPDSYLSVGGCTLTIAPEDEHIPDIQRVNLGISILASDFDTSSEY